MYYCVFGFVDARLARDLTTAGAARAPAYRLEQ